MKLQAYIKKLPTGKYRVYGESGKNLGTYPSLSKAKARLKRVGFFKHRGTTLSESMMEILAGLISGCGLYPTDKEIEAVATVENVSKDDLASALVWLRGESKEK